MIIYNKILIINDMNHNFAAHPRLKEDTTNITLDDIIYHRKLAVLHKN